jgi:hypothetical protein
MTNLPGFSGGGGSGDIFVKWNGKDVSQFEASPANLPAGWSVPVLSVVADVTAPSGSVLRLGWTGDASLDTLVWLLNDTPAWESALTDDDNRSVEMTMDVTVGGAGGHLAGFAFLGDDTDGAGYHGFQIAQTSPNGDTSILEQGVVDASNISIGSSTVAMRYRVRVIAGKQAGVPPTWIASWRALADGATSEGREDQTPLTAAGASWNNLACDRLGICINAASAGAHTVDIRHLNFKLLKEAA